MQRQEFEQHPLWTQIDDALNWLEKVRETKPGVEEILVLRRIEVILNHVASHKSMAASFSALFNALLLDPVLNDTRYVSNHLQQRLQGAPYRSYTNNAQANAEQLLVGIGLWPRPFARGGQVAQMRTLFEDLFEAQDREIEALSAKYNEAKSQIDLLVTEFNEKKSQVENEFEIYRSDALAISNSVDTEKSRVDDVVQKGLERVSELQQKNTDAFEAWKRATSEEWATYAEGKKQVIADALKSAGSSVETIKALETEYANISTAAGGAKLAAEFDKEAKEAQKLGLWLYGIGFAVLAAAAAPLVFWLVFPPSIQPGDGVWQHFLIRISLGVLGASAATVLIRLGSRFVTGATASRRMALELQTFGPFLANVRDKETVDGARLELVDRAFGKSYAPGEADSKDDAVPVSAFAHILDLVKAIK